MSFALRFQIHCYGGDGTEVTGCVTSLMQISFEELAERLSKLDRMFFEMDGSFVWTGTHVDLGPWQLDGMVYDHQNRVQRVELKGFLPRENWRVLMQVLGWPQQPLTIHDLDAAEFRSVLQFETKIWGA